MSKRSDRVAAAKARGKRETSELRNAERRPVAPSKFRKFTVVWDKWTLLELRNKKEGRVGRNKS